MRRAFVAVAAVILAFVGAQATFSIHSSEMRPDLLELEPKDFTIQTTSGEQRLSYDLETVNGHTGPLEVFPTRKKCTTGPGANGRIVKQNVYHDSNGNGYFERGTDTQADSYTVGCMTFHRFHVHWHFDAFVGSFLWELDEAGNRVGEAVASSPKQSFCIADVRPRQDMFEPDLPGSPNSAYYTRCDRNSAQGLSVAWSDEYPNGTTGQYLVITGLTGDFCFEAIADPLEKLVEVSDTNNAESIKINLSGTSVTEYPGSTC